MSDPNLQIQRQIQNLTDQLERLRKADTPLGNVGARVYTTGATSILNSTTTTLSFDGTQFDAATPLYSAGTPSRLTAASAGLYLFGCYIDFASNATGFRRVELLLNGTGLVAIQTVPAPSGVSASITFNSLWKCAASDYMEVRVFQNSGGALNVSASSAFSAVRIS